MTLKYQINWVGQEKKLAFKGAYLIIKLYIYFVWLFSSTMKRCQTICVKILKVNSKALIFQDQMNLNMVWITWY